MRFAAGNAQHIGARSQQQDAFGFSDPSDRPYTEHAGLLGVVADGMGGLARGSEASRAAVRAFLNAYQVKTVDELIPQALRRALEAANAAVLALNRGESRAAQAGTTLAAAVLHGDALHWIAAGDSRIYLLRDQRLTRVTMDHVYARRLDEQVVQGMITRTDALEHPERANLTSYLGVQELSEIDRSVRALPLQSEDRVILCTDGFYRALSEEEVADAFRDDLNRACARLTRLALKKRRAQQDNLTVIAFSHEPDGTKYLTGRRPRSGRQRLALGAAACLSLLVLGAAAYRERDVVAARWAWIKAVIAVPLVSTPDTKASQPALPSAVGPTQPESTGSRAGSATMGQLSKSSNSAKPTDDVPAPPNGQKDDRTPTSAAPRSGDELRRDESIHPGSRSEPRPVQ